MEEDIKKVEQLIARCDNCKLKECTECGIVWNDVQSIKNLIKGYKEKDEKLNKELEIKSELIKYVNSFKNYEEYEKKNSKFSRRIMLIKQGLTINYRMCRIAHNIECILNGKKWTRG